MKREVAWQHYVGSLVGKRVLLLGEGNFSFAAALIDRLSETGEPRAFVATTYSSSLDLEHEVVKASVETIQKKGGRVLTGINATRLEDHEARLGPPFDVVIFNFPHVGGKMRMDKNRVLLSNFFASARKVLDVETDGSDGEPNILVSLCGGQGGTKFDVPKRDWGNTWQLPLYAVRNQLMLSEVFPFPTDLFPYKHTGYRGDDKSFDPGNAKSHLLRPMPNIIGTRLPPWAQYLLDPRTIATDRDILPSESILSTCVGCDPAIFSSIVTTHVVTRNLVDVMNRCGFATVSTGPSENNTRRSHPPCRVSLSVVCSGVNAEPIEDLIAPIERNVSSELNLQDSFRFDALLRCERCSSSRAATTLIVDVVGFLVRALKLENWYEILALIDGEALEPFVHVGAQVYAHHLSVWTSDTFDEDEFVRRMFHVFGVILRGLECKEVYECKESGRISRLFVLTYACNIFPFSDVSCKNFHLNILPKFLRTLDIIVR